MEEKNVIIVTESNKEIKKIGHMVMNLLSQFDNIKAVIWEEKYYISNEPTIPSTQPIIFIGETQTAKLFIDTIEWNYNELNMKYGWIGNRAILYVQKKDLSEAECNQFKKSTKLQDEKIKDGTFFKKINNISDKISNADIKIKIAGLIIGSFIMSPVVLGVTLFSFIKGGVDSAKIRKEQYTFLVKNFISDGILDFLGLTND